MQSAVKWIRGLAGASLIGMLFAGNASAATVTANLAVSASVSASCSVSTTPLAFGAYDPVGANVTAPLDATGGVVVTCTNGSSTTVTLGQGAHANTGSTDAAPRLRRSRRQDARAEQNQVPEMLEFITTERSHARAYSKRRATRLLTAVRESRPPRQPTSA